MVLYTQLLHSYAGNERLIGTWKSNKPATLDYLKTHTKLTLARLEKVGTLLGKMVFIFDERTVTFKSGDWKFISKYKIIKEDKTTIVIETENPETKKPEQTRMELDTKGFWTPDDKIPGYKERFDKNEK